MMETQLYPKRPLEFYGQFVQEPLSEELTTALVAQACPFLGRRCIKIRKSDPSQTIGACTVGYTGNAVMICPHRFIAGDTVFRDAARLLIQKKDNSRLVVIPEIPVPGGSVDYFVVALSPDQRVLDFIGLEVQTLDTTGTGGIWEAHEDLRRGFVGERYSYGLNWKMSAKTVLIQLHHKASAFEHVGKHLVLSIQREFFDYLRGQFNTSSLRAATKDDSVHFHVYDLLPGEHGFDLRLRERHSTSAAGVEQMLQIGTHTPLSANEIIVKIEAKLGEAREISY